MTAGLALAGDNTMSADQIRERIAAEAGDARPVRHRRPIPRTRPGSASFVSTVRNRKTRSLSLGEREEIAQIAATKPNINLDIQFDYNSADIRRAR